GIGVYYFTNNSARTREQIAKTLSDMGIFATPDMVYSASGAAARYIVEKGLEKVFVLGSEDLRGELSERGVDFAPSLFEARTLVLGLDRNFSYESAKNLLSLRGKDVKLVACNVDLVFPVEGGVLAPGCGLMARAAELLLDKKVDCCVGKPNTYMADLLLADTGLEKDDIVIVGDSLESDIALAEALGARSIFLSHDASKKGGDATIATLDEIFSLIK
ncbi:hypothetical protein FDZ71_07595, partial [bacterium]